MVMSLWRS